MKKILQNFWTTTLAPSNWQKQLNTRIGFFWWLIILFTMKTILAYGADFEWLHVQDPLQVFLMLANPIGFTVLIFSLALFIRPKVLYYGALILIDLILTMLLYLNVVYFREFSDFMSVNTILGYSAVNQGSKVAGSIAFGVHDILFWLDIIIILVLFVIRKIRFSDKHVPKLVPLAMTSLGLFICAVNLLLADIDRPQLLTRQFDREYMVKYLGIGPFTIYDGINTYKTNQIRKSATPEELQSVKEYVKEHHADANAKYYGIAQNKNVIVIHLESFQQFVIGKKINGQEITPFLNSLVNEQGTISFDNFFHQVGQGKTSDAENMLETSTFGLPQGSLFSKIGENQTFQAMPAILNQRAGYSSAVFHGNNGTFYQRNVVYKRMGYQNFIDSSYFDISGVKATGWGLKDKLLFNDSVPYLEKLQQPFYAKFLTVTNHTPYNLDKIDRDPNFQTTNSGSKLVDNYFLTNHYLDQSLKEFFTYLKKSGLYKNSMVVMYGDHYGISNTDNKYLAGVLGKNSNEWTDLDNTNLQRVPFIVHIPNYKGGHVNHTYGGEIDVAPTVEHLLGISTQRYMQLGQDLLSDQHQQLVAFRNKDFITPDLAVISGKIWNTKTGQVVDGSDEKTAKRVAKLQKQVNQKLAISDNLNQKNLLRFYTPEGFKAVQSDKYDYAQQTTLNRLNRINKSLGSKSTSVFSKNGNRSTLSQYVTDAPEAEDEEGDTTRIKPRNPDDWSAE